MEAQVNICIVAHHARRQQAYQLAEILDAHVVMDESGIGANANHRRALRWAAERQGRTIVVEDDAQPVEGFRILARELLSDHPSDLVSLYLGTGRPPQYQPVIRQALEMADEYGRRTITLPTLIHGVCYSVPTQALPRMLANWPRYMPADYAVGHAWGGPVRYAVQSLVEHADGPSVERHQDGQEREERRKAWRLHRGVKRESIREAA